MSKTHLATEPITTDLTHVACSPHKRMGFSQTVRPVVTSDGSLSFPGVTCLRCLANLLKWIANPALYQQYRQRGT
jgi:hypothetical protein